MRAVCAFFILLYAMAVALGMAITLAGCTAPMVQTNRTLTVNVYSTNVTATVETLVEKDIGITPTIRGSLK